MLVKNRQHSIEERETVCESSCRWVTTDRVDYDAASGLYRVLILLATKCGATMAICDATKVSYGVDAIMCIEAFTEACVFRKHNSGVALEPRETCDKAYCGLECICRRVSSHSARADLTTRCADAASRASSDVKITFASCASASMHLHTFCRSDGMFKACALNGLKRVSFYGAGAGVPSAFPGRAARMDHADRGRDQERHRGCRPDGGLLLGLQQGALRNTIGELGFRVNQRFRARPR